MFKRGGGFNVYARQSEQCGMEQESNMILGMESGLKDYVFVNYDTYNTWTQVFL